MKTNRLLLTLTLAVISLISIGCSSGGGDSAPPPTDPDTVFSLATLQSTTVGTVYSTQLTGNDTNGATYSGSLTMANRAQTMLDGVLVTPHDLILALTDGVTPISIVGTSYTDTSGNFISMVIQSIGLVCTPVSPDSMPSSVKIGDFGIRSPLVCNDDTTKAGNWRVEDGGNGTAKVISNVTTTDQFNTIVSVGESSFTINANGDILATKTVSTLMATNFTLTYQSI